MRATIGYIFGLACVFHAPNLRAVDPAVAEALPAISKAVAALKNRGLSMSMDSPAKEKISMLKRGLDLDLTSDERLQITVTLALVTFAEQLDSELAVKYAEDAIAINKDSRDALLIYFMAASIAGDTLDKIEAAIKRVRPFIDSHGDCSKYITCRSKLAMLYMQRARFTNDPEDLRLARTEFQNAQREGEEIQGVPGGIDTYLKAVEATLKEVMKGK